MTAATKPVLSDDLRQALAIAGVEVRRGYLRPESLERVVTLLDGMAPGEAVRADRPIASAASLFNSVQVRRGLRTLLSALFARRPFATRELPDAEHLLMFHFSGYVREEALHRFHGGLRSPFFLAAVAYRLNDWVPEVRRAAQACAARTFPLTDPAIVAEGAIPLLLRRRAWRRWTSEADVLDQAIMRTDVLACLVEFIRRSDKGPMAAVLSEMLRSPHIDDRLPELAADGVQPAVRGTALKALIDGKATWQTGYDRQWISKPDGLSRRVPIYAERELATEPSRERFLEMAAHDRSAAVRRVAAAALIRYGGSVENLADVMRALAHDTSRSIRERVDFLRKTLHA